jgi:hypothetical protein
MHRVDAVEQSTSLVKSNQRLGFFPIFHHASLERLQCIVRSLDEPSATMGTEVCRAGDVQSDTKGLLALAAKHPLPDPLSQDRFISFKGKNYIERPLLLLKDLLESERLCLCPRKPIEDKLPVMRANPAVDYGNYEIIRNELASRGEFVCLAAELSAPALLFAQNGTR